MVLSVLKCLETLQLVQVTQVQLLVTQTKMVLMVLGMLSTQQVQFLLVIKQDISTEVKTEQHLQQLLAQNMLVLLQVTSKLKVCQLRLT